MTTKLFRHFNEQGNELPPTYIEISDEQLYQEKLVEEFNSVHTQAILALKNWSSLTLVQKDIILKNLIKWTLWKDGWLKLDELPNKE